MADNVVEERVLKVKKAAFEGVDIAVAVDRGCSLTKVLYTTAGSSDDEYNLHLALFSNQSFEASIDYLASKCFIKQNDSGALHVTGAGGDRYKGLIQEKLGLEVQFADELPSAVEGARWLLKSLPLESVCHPEEQIDLSLYSKMAANPEAQGLTQQWQVKGDAASGDGPFPFLFGIFGSGGGFLQVPESGPWTPVCGVGFSGKPFLGYAKMLLGTSDYEEIMRLASAGNRASVDNQARDILQADKDTPYGRLPASVPIFPFGKVVDRGLTRDQCNKADIAHSLVAAFAANLFNTMCTAAKLTATTTVVMGGNLFRHSLIRQEVIKQQKYFDMHSLKIHFLATGHTGAIGAMLSGRNSATQQ